MSRLAQDLRFAVRLLWKDPTFTATALLTLAVCIGANTAIFGVVRSVLLKPLPIEGASDLVLIYNSYPNAGAPRVGAAVPDLYDRREAVPALVDQTLLRREGTTFGDTEGAQRLNTLRATPSFYRLAHMVPVTGQVFSEADAEPGQPARAVLAYGFWQRQFGGDRSIVGQTIRLSGQPVTVIGVAPADFTFLWDDIDVYQAVAFTPEQKSDEQRHSNNWQMVARLAPGATITQAQQQIDALNVRNDERFPNFKQLLADAGFHTVVVSLQDDLVRDVRPVLYLLWGGVLFVLLIGGFNLANLAMVRASARTREMATRHAIGGELGRLARQLFTETLLLAVVGGVIGMLLGWWAVTWVASLDLDGLPRVHEVALDGVSLAVALGVTLVTGLAIGLAPVVRLWRMNLNLELREEGRGGTAGRRAHLLRRALATAQVAVAFVLLIGAGLLFASLRAVLGLDMGFDPTHVQVASLSLPNASYPDAAALRTFEQRLLAEVRTLPGVASAGLTSAVPFEGDISNSVILAEGYVMKPGESLLAPSRLEVGTGYLEAMGVELLSGRFFDASDVTDAPRTVIIDDRLARKFWPDRDPVGRRLYRPDDPKDITRITPNTEFMTVVGVIREVQMTDPRAGFTPVGAYYFPYQQTPFRTGHLVVRTANENPAIMTSVRQKLQAIDPELPLYAVQPMQHYIDVAMSGRRIPMYVAMVFGLVGLFLAALGIYGVLAYGVAQRRRELGVRMALGGSASSVFGLVLTDGVKITLIGLALGVGGAWLVGRAMAGQLYDVAPMDPVVLASVAGVLLVVAMIASIIPSWRASRINPVIALGQ
ncbi:MAG: ABC transporter permease [Vicinamibacterales bacterium]